MKYRKKPVVIEAKKIPAVADMDGRLAFEDWINQRRGDRETYWRGDKLRIATLEGVMEGQVGDYVICGVAGELYPCKPDIFVETYEPVE